MKKMMKKAIMILSILMVIGIFTLEIEAKADTRKNEEKLQEYDDSQIASFEEFLKLGIKVKDESEVKRERIGKSKINIITKNLTWNGELDLSNNPKKIVMHHIEASKNDGNFKVEEINEWHKNNGWSGIGYHFYINKKGEIYRGRPENAIGAHALNNNIDTLGIAVEGKYNTETMPKVQKEAVMLLGKYIRQKYGIDTINKHKDLVATSCPGNNYPFTEIKTEILTEKLLSTKVYKWTEENRKFFLVDTWIDSKAEGEIEYKEKKYIVNKINGIVNSGWYEIDGREVYINSKNMYAIGWEKIGQEWYYFDEKGQKKTGWIYLSGEWYLLNENGQMETGWYFDGTDWYYMDIDGKMKKDWYFDNFDWYLFEENGRMKKGWYFDGLDWYLFDVDGKMKKDWYFDGTHWYLMDNGGRMKKDWYFDQKWYYLNNSGQMQKNWQLIDNEWYYFYENGVMASDTVIDGWKIANNGIAKKL